MKIILENIAQIGSRIQLNDYMKLNEYQSKGHSLTLAKGFKFKLVFLRHCSFI